MSLRPTREIEREKRELVAEQSGFTWALAAVGVAFLFGILFKGSLSPQRVQQLVEQASAKVHKDVNVKFSTARLSLSDGFWPELAVVIENLSFESDQVCWMTPVLEANIIKLPLDLSSLFSGKVVIKEIFADQVTLSLRTDLKDCKHRQPASESGVPAASASVASGAEAKPDSAVKPLLIENLQREKNSVERLSVKSFRVNYLPQAFTSVEVQDLNVSLKSKQPRKIDISGFLNLGGETLSGDYSSQARIEVEYAEDQVPSWTSRLTGNWREGHYRLQGTYDPETQAYKVDSNLDHIPLSQVLPLLRKHHLLSDDLNGKDVWISLLANSQGFANSAAHPLEVSKIKMEGDLGEIEVDRISSKDIAKGSFDPFEMQIHSLNFSNLAKFLNRTLKSESLGQLGVFHGKIRFQSRDQIKITGEHSGLEFIFSSRGQRQAQSIALITGEAELKNQVWRLRLDRLHPSEGLFLGQADIKSDANFENIEARLVMEDLTLSPEVQKLMTAGGQLTSLAGNVSVKIKQGKLSEINGSVDAPEVVLAGTQFVRPKLYIRTVKPMIASSAKTLGSKERDGTGVIINTKLVTRKIDFKASTPISDVAAKFLESNWWTQEHISIENVEAQIETDTSGKAQWKIASWIMPLGKSVKFNSEGQWTPQGALDGVLILQNSKNSKKYKVSGHRDDPQFKLEGESADSH